jgi:hypothetical protein
MTTAGNFTGTVVRDNVIYGGFASGNPDNSTDTKGDNKEDAIIKLVTGRSMFPSFHAKLSSYAGLVLQLDLELGSVTGTSRTSVSLARSSAIA